MGGICWALLWRCGGYFGAQGGAVCGLYTVVLIECSGLLIVFVHSIQFAACCYRHTIVTLFGVLLHVAACGIMSLSRSSSIHSRASWTRGISGLDRLDVNIRSLYSVLDLLRSIFPILVGFRIRIRVWRQRFKGSIAQPLLVNTPSPGLIQDDAETAKDYKGTAYCSACIHVSFGLPGRLEATYRRCPSFPPTALRHPRTGRSAPRH